MKSRTFLFIIFSAIILAGASTVIILRSIKSDQLRKEIAAYSGSESCRPCHERFYQLWHDSHHGLAMQPVTGEFIDKNINSDSDIIKVGIDYFKVSREGDTLLFVETKRSGEENKYPAIHTMGGKYIYYFLTPLSGGRLQVLPLAYDCKQDTWYNNPESGVRHFETLEDAPLDWMNYLYTFNTTCYNCHVSQLETNYDLADNTYNTTWREPGINCETCHGPSQAHIEVCVEAGEGNIPEDLKIVQTSIYSPEQHNAACASCHAKASVIAESFEPGARFYDYFDLITLENPDFYADGRDLGENYTMTTWEMNKCADKSGMHCVSCHTSSGRYRFAGENENDACMPCHADKVNNVSSHSFHLADSEGSKCIACHMPKTSFARMDRSDHSFRPPMPGASIAFGSPNACNICHTDKSAEWAMESIRTTHNKIYDEETIANGKLIRKAREGDWSGLQAILSGLEQDRFDRVYSTSFIRLLENCDRIEKWPVLIKMTEHSSPLVRGAAAHSLYLSNSDAAFKRLTELVDDDYRLVRINAAYAISSYPDYFIKQTDSLKIKNALKEYEHSLTTNPDDWSAHYNLGNFYSNQNNMDKALESYATSLRIYPEAIMPMVNAGFINSIIGNYQEAEELFTRALSYDPDHEAALLNLALLYGESGNTEMAKQHFERLLDVSPRNSVAAYNLAIMESQNDLAEAVDLSRKAMEWSPDNIKYKYTYAYYLTIAESTENAKTILRSIISENPAHFDSYYLLSSILINNGETSEAVKILQTANEINGFSPEQRQAIANRIKQIMQNED